MHVWVLETWHLEDTHVSLCSIHVSTFLGHEHARQMLDKLVLCRLLLCCILLSMYDCQSQSDEQKRQPAIE